MPQNHVGPYGLPQGIKTVAFYSIIRPKNLIVFVHGFGGSAVTTWNDFPSILTSDDEFAETDIIFYGYDSLRTQANNLGLRFYQFLNNHNTPQVKAFNQKRNVDENFEYEKIVIVAHSLGAIVTRRALLNAKADNKSWLAKCKMVLFAPAHRGARIQAILKECLPGISKVFAGFGYTIYPVTDDLKPDSIAIQNLIGDSQAYINDGDGDFTIANSVIWAGNEIVVHNERFCSDPIAEEIPNKKHTSICKPRLANYIQPLDFVKTALN